MLKKQDLQVSVTEEPNANLMWDGYPGHLTQVLVNFFQNTVRYGYEENQRGGKIDIALDSVAGNKGKLLKVVYRDHGKGIAARDPAAAIRAVRDVGSKSRRHGSGSGDIAQHHYEFAGWDGESREHAWTRCSIQSCWRCTRRSRRRQISRV